ncbi:MAG: primosome assembly protein PriA [Promicromonosporaceae bacterium]|nr:primosome assembly protein PriA [Promicromonosporaceae bacterium]
MKDGVPTWAAAVTEAVAVATRQGRGVLIVAADRRDVQRLEAALTDAGVTDMARLLAEEGPAARYRAFLQAARGQARVVIGTRAAMFAPVKNLGLCVLWGDGEETLDEPHAPYPNARDVLALRSGLTNTALLIGSPGRSIAAQGLVGNWARELAAPREAVRAAAARVQALTSQETARDGVAARLPSAAWRQIKAALESGPVLIQVPRGGYLPGVACGRCRTAATCQACHGPLRLPAGDAAPQCTWCGRLAAGWQCPECGGTALRAIRIGAERTAEEIGRAFPGSRVILSAAGAPGGVKDSVTGEPQLVIATPGAEPVAPEGYAALAILDAGNATAGARLEGAAEVLRRWLAAAHLVRGADEGGRVLLVGDGPPRPTGALVRFDPAWLAARELAERHELHLPPAYRVAAVTGEAAAVRAVLGRVGLATPEAVLGPVEVEPPRTHPPAAGPALLFAEATVRAIVRVPAAAGLQLAEQLKASLAVRSAKREPGAVRVQLDPAEI